MFERFSKSLHLFPIFQPRYKGMRVWLKTFAQCCGSWKGTKAWDEVHFISLLFVCDYVCCIYFLMSYFVSTSKQTCPLLWFVCVRCMAILPSFTCLCFQSHSYSPLVCDFSFWHISGLFFLVVFNRLQCSQSKYIQTTTSPFSPLSAFSVYLRF